MKFVKKVIIFWYKRDSHILNLSLKKRIFLYIFSLIVITLTLLSLIYSFLPKNISYVLYPISALLLCVSVFYLVKDIIYIKRKLIVPSLNKNHFIQYLLSDYCYRTICFTYLSLNVNIAFAIMNGIYGIINHSWWFITFTVYYILLSIMRARILLIERKNKKLEQNQLTKNEWRIYKSSGIMFLFLTITMIGTVRLIVTNYGTKHYPETLIFMVALYTFYKIIIAIINLFKVRKLGSTLFSVIHFIGYADALASIILLQTAMFFSFSDGNKEVEFIMNSTTGIVVCTMILTMGIYMIIKGSNHLKNS